MVFNTLQNLPKCVSVDNVIDAQIYQQLSYQLLELLLRQFTVHSAPILPLLPISKFGLIQLYFLSRVTAHCQGNHIKMLMGSLTNLLDSTSAVQQSINFFFLCSLFHCLQVVIPSVYHSLLALDSLLLPSSLSVNTCQKRISEFSQEPPKLPS